jgi:hypothetical protein
MQPQAEDEATARAGSLIARALSELQFNASNRGVAEVREELRATREAVDAASQRLDAYLNDDREQRSVLAERLGGLAGSLDALVNQLQGLSALMTELVDRVAERRPQTEPQEPAFRPGGEGVTLALNSVPGFQGLMEIQKALTRMDEVAGVSVERYQEGDSRLILHLRAPVSASTLTESLRSATGFNLSIEESKPELLRLRLKVIPAG